MVGMMNTQYTDTQLKQEIYGRWTVLTKGIVKSGREYAYCQCSCGTEREVRLRSLTNGESVSCGCHRREVARKTHTTHGLSNTPEYYVWESMRQRCYDTNCDCYPRYGGRGIKVCERWESFANFIADMGKRPNEQYSIERIDNECNYSPANCVWATQEQQQNNKRSNRLITAFGKTQNVKQWSKETGIDYFVIIWRLNNSWNEERALTP